MISLGLRFRRSDVRVLTAIRNAAAERGQGDVGLYDKAVAATQIGEPLVVVAETVDEVRTMAALFGTLGCRQPVIEEINPGAAGA